MGARFLSGELGMMYVLLEDAAEAGVRVVASEDTETCCVMPVP